MWTVVALPVNHLSENTSHSSKEFLSKLLLLARLNVIARTNACVTASSSTVDHSNENHQTKGCRQAWLLQNAVVNSVDGDCLSEACASASSVDGGSLELKHQAK